LNRGVFRYVRRNRSSPWRSIAAISSSSAAICRHGIGVSAILFRVVRKYSQFGRRPELTLAITYFDPIGTYTIEVSACIIRLRLHPGLRFRALPVFHPAIRIDNVDPEVSISNFADDSVWRLAGGWDLCRDAFAPKCDCAQNEYSVKHQHFARPHGYFTLVLVANDLRLSYWASGVRIHFGLW
jgi:hypothetical protein